jgi:hypothetical protein
LQQASAVLGKIEAVIDGKSKGDLADLSSEFYTLVPHNFGPLPSLYLCAACF